MRGEGAMDQRGRQDRDGESRNGSRRLQMKKRAFTLMETMVGCVLFTMVLLASLAMITSDPDPASSTYNQTYQPFSLLTMSTRRGVTFNLVTQQKTVPKYRYARMRTSVVLQNIR